MKTILTTLSQSVFFWNTLNGVISVTIQQLAWMPYEALPILIAIINYVSKAVNKEYNSNYKK